MGYMTARRMSSHITNLHRVRVERQASWTTSKTITEHVNPTGMSWSGWGEWSDGNRGEWLEWYHSSGDQQPYNPGRTAGIAVGVLLVFLALIIVPLGIICRNRKRQSRQRGYGISTTHMGTSGSFQNYALEAQTPDITVDDFETTSVEPQSTINNATSPSAPPPCYDEAIDSDVYIIPYDHHQDTNRGNDNSTDDPGRYHANNTPESVYDDTYPDEELPPYDASFMQLPCDHTGDGEGNRHMDSAHAELDREHVVVDRPYQGADGDWPHEGGDSLHEGGDRIHQGGDRIHRMDQPQLSPPPYDLDYGNPNGDEHSDTYFSQMPCNPAYNHYGTSAIDAQSNNTGLSGVPPHSSPVSGSGDASVQSIPGQHSAVTQPDRSVTAPEGRSNTSPCDDSSVTGSVTYHVHGGQDLYSQVSPPLFRREQPSSQVTTEISDEIWI